MLFLRLSKLKESMEMLSNLWNSSLFFSVIRKNNTDGIRWYVNSFISYKLLKLNYDLKKTLSHILETRKLNRCGMVIYFLHFFINLLYVCKNWNSCIYVSLTCWYVEHYVHMYVSCLNVEHKLNIMYPSIILVTIQHI